jgi:purine nucleoside permease
MSKSLRFLWASALVVLCLSGGLAEARPIPVKVVVLTTFEVGADTGDMPGEYQHWVEADPKAQVVPVAGIESPVRYSSNGVLAVKTGMRARPREAIAALVSGGQFDVSRAYWVVAGIAGVDPAAGSIGSAAWANWVVDADTPYEMDDREIPADWPWGIWALGTDRPGLKGSAKGSSGMAWKLDPGLVQFAYGLTRDLALPDNAQLASARALYPSEPAAMTPPKVFLGDVLGATRFWHGTRRTAWARDWVKVQTDGAGNMAMSDCEDQGILDVLTIYGAQGKVDPRRVLVLRTASNYTRQPDGADPVLRHFPDGGGKAAFDAAYQVASPVVSALVAGWATYRDTLPGA